MSRSRSVPSARRAAGAALPRWSAVFVAAVILAIGAAHIAYLWFVCDDAYISYRYAANLAHGLGPVFNAGERVEGYSSFLWMILGATVLRLGGEPQVWMPVLSALAALATLGLVMHAHHSRGMNLLPAGFLLAASPCFGAWGTGGLETALFTLTLTGGILALMRATASRQRQDPASRPAAEGGQVVADALRTSLASGFLFALATLTRPEGLFLSPIAGAWLLYAVLRKRAPWRAWGAWAAIWLACVAPQLAWRASYYGRLLPNSYYIKSPGFPNVMEGLGYVLRSIRDLHLYLPILAAVVLFTAAGRARLRAAALGPIAAAIAIYGAYVTTTGGDFMPLYRFVAPIMPLFALAAGAVMLAAHAAMTARWSRGVALVVTASILAGYSLLNVQRTLREPDVWTEGTLASVGLMRQQVHDWGEVGRELRRVSAPTDTLATTAAGIIPYESRLYTLDLLGLNAPDLRRFRERKGMPGHRWLLSEEWLWRLAPQFLLGHPMVRPADRGIDLSLDLKPEWRERFGREYQLIAFPLSDWPPRRVGCMVRRDVARRVSQAGP
jgi:arabinofuranosyltransferase